MSLSPEQEAQAKAAWEKVDATRYGDLPDGKADPLGRKSRVKTILWKRMIRLAAQDRVADIYNAIFQADPTLFQADPETVYQAFAREVEARKEAASAETKLAAKNIQRQGPKRLGEIMTANPLIPPAPDKPTTPISNGPVNLFGQPKPPAPVDEAQAELDKHFPRDAAGNPLSASEAEARLVDDEPTPPPPPAPAGWQADDAKVAAFRKAAVAEIERVHGEGAVAPAGINDIVKAALGGTIHEWAGSGSEALSKIKSYLKAQQPPDDYPAESVAEMAQNGGENTPPAMVTPKPAETPRQAPKTGQIEKANGHTAITRYEPVPVTAETAGWLVQVQQAEMFIKSGLLPSSIRTVEQVITIAEMGKVLGVPPMVAINNINVIQGKPTVAPQLMLALIRKSGQLADLKIEDDGNACTVTMTRKGETAHVEKFSMADASAMGLAGKDNWRKQPAVMRKWRAISAACRIVFPDVIWGFYTPEEME